MKKNILLLMVSFLLLTSSYGGVMVLKSMSAGTKKVWLFKQNGVDLSVVDSAVTTGTQQNFPNLSAGNYSLKVYYVGDPTRLPTYLGNVALWGSALTFAVGPTIYDSVFKAITPISLSAFSGTGNISGSISQGNARIAAYGDPMSNIEVMLLDESTNAPLAYTFTDVNGNYQFINIPYGTYKVYVESVGRANSNPPLATINSTNPSQAGVNIEINSNYVGQTVTGITNSENNFLKVYPNPTSEKIVLELNDTAVIEIVDLDGKEVARVQAQGNKTEINVGDFKGGLYQIRIRKGDDLIEGGKFIKQ